MIDKTINLTRTQRQILAGNVASLPATVRDDFLKHVADRLRPIKDIRDSDVANIAYEVACHIGWES